MKSVLTYKSIWEIRPNRSPGVKYVESYGNYDG